MNKIAVWILCAVMLLSSCGTYKEQGALVGGQFGTILGSAIGGIIGGPRGSDVGTIVGMAGGAVVGAAIGQAADKQRAEQIEQMRQRRQQPAGIDNDNRQSTNRQDQTDANHQRTDVDPTDDSGFDVTNSGDDRITLDMPGPKGSVKVATDTLNMPGPKGSVKVATDTLGSSRRVAELPIGRMQDVGELIEIRHAALTDADGDSVIVAGEECRVTFEIINRSRQPLYNVQPVVNDVTGNKHIHISPNLTVECIPAGAGIRYTATIKADAKLKDGEAKIEVTAQQPNSAITSQVKTLTIVTKKRKG